MAMGKRKRDRQPTMWVTTTDLPTAASHPFYIRLNHLLREHGFDDFAEARCATFYADTMGRPDADEGDTTTIQETLPEAAEQLEAVAVGTPRVLQGRSAATATLLTV